MKTRFNFIGIAQIVFIPAIFMLSGCKKENDDHAIYRDVSGSQVTAEGLFEDVLKQVDEGAKSSDNDLYNGAGIKSTLPGGCATVTIAPFDTINWPKTITIDFGVTNCLGNDGKYRRGIITATLSGRYKDSLTVITIIPEGYYVNDNKVEGAKTVTNLGHVTEGHLTFSIKVENGTITKPDGSQVKWESERRRVWAEGEETPWPTIGDDVYLISGTASGTTANGRNFSITTVKDLRVEIGCKWIVSGTLEIQPEGKPLRTLDYGDGTCDNQATLTVNGNTFNITLP
jgi:hypothetical protein